MTKGQILLAMTAYVMVFLIASGIQYWIAYMKLKRNSNLSDYGIRSVLDFGDILLCTLIIQTLLAFGISLILTIINIWEDPL